VIFTIGQTAKAVGLSKTSICKHIENGKLSATWNEQTNPRQREIDASEILRVYRVDMSLPPSERKPVTHESANVDTPLQLVVKAKDETIATLKAEVERLASQLDQKDEQLAAVNRLLAAPKPDDRYDALLEKLTSLQEDFAETVAAKTPPTPQPNRGIFGWFRGRQAEGGRAA
jgi:uncharacterized small protein (DUF1192 family)